MLTANWLQFGVLIALVLVTTPLLGGYMAKVFATDGTKAPGDRVLAPVERTIYRIVGVDPKREQRWQIYALSLLGFSLVSVLFVYLVQRLQGSLPLNPENIGAVPAALGWNTAVSFVTNTNWQNYVPE